MTEPIGGESPFGHELVSRTRLSFDLNILSFLLSVSLDLKIEPIVFVHM